METPPSGFNVTVIDQNRIRFQGTVPVNTPYWSTYYRSVTVTPDYLKAGKTYMITINGAPNNNIIYFEVLGFVNGSASNQLSISGLRYSDGHYTFKMPSGWSGGVYIRFGFNRQNVSTTIDYTIEYHLYTINNISDMLNDYDKYTSCNNLPNGVTFVSSSSDVLSIPDAPGIGFIQTYSMHSNSVKFQLYYPYYPKNEGAHYPMYRQYGYNSSWSDWSFTFDSPVIPRFLYGTEDDYTSCDDIRNQSIVFVGSRSGVLSIPDAPGIGFIQTYSSEAFPNADAQLFQIFYPWHENDKIKYRTCQYLSEMTWSNWKTIDTGSTTTIQQQISNDTYNNTYNITTTPNITTDSNGWLQSVDTDTSSETNKTDMTGPIMAMLNSTGYCHLGPGIFYVSGGINMPAGSMLEGCGKQTIIRLLQSTTSGYIVRMHTNSTIKNVCFSGGYNALDYNITNISGRNGVHYIGNRDGQTPSVTPSACKCCMIEGCFFENLGSGIYGYNAGGGLHEGLEVVNCYFQTCTVGINIDYWTEYCKFTNCITFQCHWGCINNGGNNVFTACTFHGVVGFMIDNSSGNKTNNAHGSVIGCTFNHIDNMNNPSSLGNGWAIRVIGTENGFMFSDCQIWYGKIYVENSKGIQFNSFEMGGGMSEQKIKTEGQYTVFFTDCLFQSTPTMQLNSPTRFTNCYTYDNTQVG